MPFFLICFLFWLCRMFFLFFFFFAFFHSRMWVISCPWVPSFFPSVYHPSVCFCGSQFNGQLEKVKSLFPSPLTCFEAPTIAKISSPWFITFMSYLFSLLFYYFMFFEPTVASHYSCAWRKLRWNIHAILTILRKLFIFIWIKIIYFQIVVDTADTVSYTNFDL